MGSGRERHRRRRKQYDEDDEEGGIAGWKLGLVVGVVVVCFAMLYPSVLHPMLMTLLGHREPAPATPSRPPIHPGMGGGGRGGPPRHEHPAMRMAAAQAEAQTQSSGRGMFTWMLPLYTVGVVVFLLYTLFKSKKKKKRRHRYDSDSDDDEEEDSRFASKLGKKKVRDLKERLRQTEEAMSKILEQLEQVGLQTQEVVQAGTSTSDEQKNAEEVPAITQESEQYIGDLERALQQFKDLSAQYEKAAGERASSSEDRHRSSCSDEESSQNYSEEEDVRLPTEEVQLPKKAEPLKVVKRKSRRDD